MSIHDAIARSALLATLVLATGCGPGETGIAGVTVTSSGVSPTSGGPAPLCVTLTADPPVTIDSVSFSGAVDGATRTEVVAGADGTELCATVCACNEGVVGTVTVTKGDDSVVVDVTWPAEVCCESGGSFGPDGGF